LGFETIWDWGFKFGVELGIFGVLNGFDWGLKFGAKLGFFGGLK